MPLDPRERPRERLRTVGARGLARDELLALVIGSGGVHGSVSAVAQRLSAAFPHFPRWRRRTSDRWSVFLESGPPRRPGWRRPSSSAVALRQRRSRARLRSAGPPTSNRRVGPRLRDARQEEFHALLLNTRHRVLREVFITRGILDASLIHPREVFRVAVGRGRPGVILVHNHPSGDPTPSAEDRAVTRQLSEAGRALGIPVLDHVVIGRGRYVSLASELGP